MMRRIFRSAFAHPCRLSLADTRPRPSIRSCTHKAERWRRPPLLSRSGSPRPPRCGAAVNSRRFIQSPRRRGRVRSPAPRAQAPWRFEVDDQLILGRRLHGQVAWLRLGGRGRRRMPPAGTVRPGRHRRHEPADRCEVAERVNRGQMVSRQQCNDRLAKRNCNEVRQYDYATVRLPRERLDGAFHGRAFLFRPSQRVIGVI